MPPITALLHTRNDALRLGRTLETLLPCAQLVIVDHHSTDATSRIARKYGAHIIPTDTTTAAIPYLGHVRCEWILCLNPSESLTEGLQATLFEWSLLAGTKISATASFSVLVREQMAGNWLEYPSPETRLIHRSWTRWKGHLPAHDSGSIALEGEVLRLPFP